MGKINKIVHLWLTHSRPSITIDYPEVRVTTFLIVFAAIAVCVGISVGIAPTPPDTPLYSFNTLLSLLSQSFGVPVREPCVASFHFPSNPVLPLTSIPNLGSVAISNLNQSWFSIKNSRTLWLNACFWGDISCWGWEIRPGRSMTARSREDEWSIDGRRGGGHTWSSHKVLSFFQVNTDNRSRT